MTPLSSSMAPDFDGATAVRRSVDWPTMEAVMALCVCADNCVLLGSVRAELSKILPCG